jgi:hypothetical protein
LALRFVALNMTTTCSSKRNEMQIDEENIENMFVNMLLKKKTLK